MAFLKQLWNYILQNIVAPTRPSSSQVWELVMPFGRSASIRRHAATVIVARVQLICLVFAVLVPICSIIDFLVFGWDTAIKLTVLRLIASAIFAMLAWPRDISVRRPYIQALVMLSIMLMVPSLFYLMAMMLVDIHYLTATQRLVLQLYAFMPSIVLGGLAIFPLSALEILLFACPILGVALVGMSLSGGDLSLAQHGAALWFMCMMTGVAMFSGMTQSHYMERLVYRAMTDQLTGAQTRRSGVEALERMFMMAESSDKPLALAFFDIDHFKAINDSFGHEAGDVVLVEFATRLRSSLRSGDMLIRWGGEEFVVALPDMSADKLTIFLERLRVAGMGLRADGQPLTASIGMAEREQDKAQDWQELVDRADQRMYLAKRSGRACAVLPGQEIVPMPMPLTADAS